MDAVDTLAEEWPCKWKDPISRRLCRKREQQLFDTLQDSKADALLDEAASKPPAPPVPGQPLKLAKAGGNPKAKKEKSATEKELDRLKSGKLIRWGVTAGVGPAMFAPLHYAKNRMYSTPGAGALPYIMFHPRYWKETPEQNIYCANRWSGEESTTAAQEAADDSAKARAERVVKVLVTQAQIEGLSASAVVETVCPNQSCAPAAERMLALARADDDTATGKAAHADLVELVQRSSIGWSSGIAAKCGWYKYFGLWVGYQIHGDRALRARRRRRPARPPRRHPADRVRLWDQPERLRVDPRRALARQGQPPSGRRQRRRIGRVVRIRPRRQPRSRRTLRQVIAMQRTLLLIMLCLLLGCPVRDGDSDSSTSSGPSSSTGDEPTAGSSTTAVGTSEAG